MASLCRRESLQSLEPSCLPELFAVSASSLLLVGTTTMTSASVVAAPTPTAQPGARVLSDADRVEKVSLS